MTPRLIETEPLSGTAAGSTLAGSAAALLETHPSAAPVEKRPLRFVELDALRGVAAMMVVLFHYSLGTYIVTREKHNHVVFLLRPFIAGHQAVILFFLLSGFVLSLSTWKGSATPYKQYFIRRVCRIYLPYLGALGIGILACGLFQHILPTPDWPLRPWSEPPTLHTIWQHVLFLGDYDNWRYNQSFWTLSVEMRISLVFPFLCLLLLRMKTGPAVALAAVTSLAALAYVFVYPAGHGSRYPGGYAYTVHYVAFFILGALLARRLSREPWPSIPPALRHAMVPAAIVLFTYSVLLNRLVPAWSQGTAEMATDWPVAVGGLGLIYLAATHRHVKLTLSHAIPRYLGQISYSVYLLHNMVLYALRIVAHERFSVVVLFPIYIVSTITLASLFHFAVERPAMKLGRRLTAPRVRSASV
ncbi:MAG TPA: acyltransferase [Acidisarcina sp.]